MDRAPLDPNWQTAALLTARRAIEHGDRSAALEVLAGIARGELPAEDLEPVVSEALVATARAEVSADVVQCARAVGWRFRTWIIWDKEQAGAGTGRGSIDSASAPNVTAPVESVLVFYRGSWRRDGPAAMPHERWQEWCGPRGLWRFPGVDDPAHPTPFPEELPERCITLFSFPEDVVGDPFVGRGTTAAVAARLGRVAWAADRDPACVARARAWVTRERGGER